ncbi:hypothetical protein [Variovorax sp. dw_954]|nr:hypothetical protein [Variovorax sp. dw_954]
MNRQTARELDPSSWPAFDASALHNPQQAIYFARHQAQSNSTSPTYR